MQNISKVLETGSSGEKIKVLETLENTNNPKIIEKIIENLDDESIQVRGEAFSTLLLNKNKISNILINSLSSTKKNIRGFTSLVLANRNEVVAIHEIRKLAKDDDSSMVRSCAIGALRHLRDEESKETFLELVLDSNLEVRKSALQAIVDFDITISEEQVNEIRKEKDNEIEKLLCKLKRNGGPEGI